MFEELNNHPLLAKAVANFDAVIICDGSGTIFKKACGYAAVLIHNTKDLDYEMVIGGDSHGTNNFAELFPIIKCLWLLRNLRPKDDGLKVIIFSDSEWTIKTGRGEYSLDYLKPNSILWESIKFTKDKWNYGIDCVHVSRNSNPWNTLCDELSKTIRINLEETKQCLNKMPPLN